MGSTPSAPDPMMSSMIQAQMYKDAAREQQRMNMVGQTTPYGKLDWVSDPSAPSGYRAVQSLSDPMQKVLDQSQTNALNSVKGAETLWNNNQAQMTGQSPQFRARDLNLQNAGQMGQFTDNQANLKLNPNQTNLDLGFDANARRLADLNKSTLDPYWKQQENNFDQKMANRGVMAGSEQYDNNYRDFHTAKSNAYNQADMNAYNTVATNAKDQFNSNNAANNQNNMNTVSEFTNNNAVTNQNNQNIMQQYQAALTGLGFNNNVQQQYQNNGYQNLNAYLQAYQAPFNTYAALNSGGQVNQPVQSIGLTQTPQETIQAPDYMGMASNNYNTQMSHSNAMMSGLFGLGGSLMGMMG